MKRLFLTLTFLVLSPLFSTASFAIDKQTFGDYQVEYTTFPSTLLDASIAKHYGIKRSKYETLLNLVVYKGEEPGGQAVSIRGTVKNLMGQQQVLNFLKIEEDNTVYYIAPIRVSNEDVMHFKIILSPSDTKREFEVKFTKTLYKD